MKILYETSFDLYEHIELELEHGLKMVMRTEREALCAPPLNTSRSGVCKMHPAMIRSWRSVAAGKEEA